MTARERLLEGLPVGERSVPLCGAPTAVLEGGEGPPVVLLHGPGEYAAKWFRVIPDLVRTHRVIAPDLPGHGESAPIDGSPVRAIDWLGALIESTCDAPPALVGHVVGGAIAARFAATRGATISRLVLVDTLGLTPFRPTPEFGAAIAAFLAQPDEETHDLLWSRCAFDLDRLRETLGDRWRSIKAYNLDRARAPALKAYQESLMTEFGLPAVAPGDLAAIRIPTALIWGRYDLATPLGVAELAAARYGWTLHVIEDAGDDPPIEQPAAFIGALRAALAHGGGDIKASGGDAPRVSRRVATGFGS